MSADPARELKTHLEELERLAKTDSHRKTLYNSFSALCYLGSEAIGAKFRPGWATGLKDREGRPLFSREEARTIEAFAKSALKPMVLDSQSQKGGANIPPLVPPVADGIVSVPATMDMSLDKTFYQIKDYMAKLNTQTQEFSRTLGPFRFFYDSKVDFKVPIPLPIPFPPFVTPVLVPIPSRAIPFLITIVAESVRLIVAFTPGVPDIAKQLSSFIVALIDLLKGDWKQAILSFAGVFGTAPLLLGLFGKVLLGIFSFVAPDLQEKLIIDMYQSGKSLIVGVILWMFATLAPDFARNIAEAQFEAIKKVVTNANEQIEKLGGMLQKSVEPAGIRLNFKKIPDTWIPSFDDIQNLQSIVRQPGIYCSSEFQGAIEPLKSIPPLRLFLELLNIPTTEEALETMCSGLAGSSIVNTMTSAIMPNVSVNPESPLGAALAAKTPTELNDKVPVTERNPDEVSPPNQKGGRKKTGKVRYRVRFTRRR